jgi:hypothetical protein
MIVHFTRGLNIILVKDFENYIYIVIYAISLLLPSRKTKYDIAK